MAISQSTRNFLTYLFGTVIVLFGTILLGALATGWQYDFATGELRETGLIIMNSEPTGASIALNGSVIKDQTPYRATNMLPGDYTVRFEKAGLRPWLKKTTVEAERVSFADYAWLLPEQIPSRLRYPDNKIVAAAQSRDRKRFAFVELQTKTNAAGEPSTTTPAVLYAGDLTREPQILYAPAQTDGAAPKIISFDTPSLNTDASWLLVRQTTSDNVATWLVMPTNPNDVSARLINLNQLLSVNPSWVGWSDTESNELFITVNGTLRRFTLNDKRLGDSIADGVQAAKWDNNRLMTVEVLADGLRWLRVRTKDRLAEPETIHQVPTSTTYAMEFFSLLGNDYTAILPDSSKQLIVTRNIFENPNARVTSVSGKNISRFTINAGGRYIVMNEQDRLFTIDLERNKRYRYGTSLAGLSSWEWMNDQHLAVVTKNQLRLIDYDGQNNELISSIMNAQTPILFWENKSLLGFVQPGGNEAARPRLTHFFLTPDKILE